MIASERKFSDAMAYAPSAMMLFAKDGRIVEVNAALCALLGYSREELLSMDARSLIAAGEEPFGLDKLIGSRPES